MYVVARQHAFLNPNTQFGAGLADDLSQAQSHITLQHFEAVFGHPDDVISVIKFGMTASAIGRGPSPCFWLSPEGEPKTGRKFIGIQLKLTGWKPVDLTLRIGNQIVSFGLDAAIRCMAAPIGLMNDCSGLIAAVRCRAAPEARMNNRFADEAAIRCVAALFDPQNDRSADEAAVRCTAAPSQLIHDRFADNSVVGCSAARYDQLNVCSAD